MATLGNLSNCQPALGTGPWYHEKGRALQMSRCTWRQLSSLLSRLWLLMATGSPYCANSGSKFDNMVDEIGLRFFRTDGHGATLFIYLFISNGNLCPLCTVLWTGTKCDHWNWIRVPPGGVTVNCPAGMWQKVKRIGFYMYCTVYQGKLQAINEL